MDPGPKPWPPDQSNIRYALFMHKCRIWVLKGKWPQRIFYNLPLGHSKRMQRKPKIVAVKMCPDRAAERRESLWFVSAIMSQKQKTLCSLCPTGQTPSFPPFASVEKKSFLWTWLCRETLSWTNTMGRLLLFSQREFTTLKWQSWRVETLCLLLKTSFDLFLISINLL